MILEREDWEEQRCCIARPEPTYHEEEGVVRIPARKVVEELDEILAANDTAKAEAHLKSWLEKARTGKDRFGELTVLNEQMGFYRSVGDREQGMRAVQEGLDLLETMDLKDSVTAGTTWINAATTMKAFGEASQAIPLYEKAWRAYSGRLDPTDYRFAGLSNNMALAYVDVGDCLHASRYYEKALSIIKNLPEGKLELAVTYVNMACMYDAWGRISGLKEEEQAPKDWDDRLWNCLEAAMGCLDDPSISRGAHYAFTCMECAATFGYFGQYRRKKDLEDRAEQIYQENREKEQI